jgi:hypothetical protein
VRGLAIAVLLLAARPIAAAERARDADLQLLDMHTAMHVGSAAATGSFGTASLVSGIDRFARGQAFAGLVYSLWGAASIVSSVTSCEQALRAYGEVRPQLSQWSEAERRPFRAKEADRLTRLAIHRGIELAIDGAGLGFGAAMALSSPGGTGSLTRELGTSLILNGAVLLAVDVFRTAVDDQVARSWRERNIVEDRGWFSLAAPFGAPLRGGAVVGIALRF